MKFKHSFHVMIDNFGLTYRLLLFRFIVTAIAVLLCLGVTYPLYIQFINSSAFQSLVQGFTEYGNNFLSGNIHALQDFSLVDLVNQSVEDFLILLHQNRLQVALIIFLILFISLLASYVKNIGNYSAGTIINDRMALHAKSSFHVALIRHLKESALYSLIYTPISFLYNGLTIIILFLLFFELLSVLPFFVSWLLFTSAFTLLVSLKMMFVSDWLPCMITDKLSNRQALIFTARRKNKHKRELFSNYLVLVILMVAGNVGGFLLTLGVGIFLTIPVTVLWLISFQFTNFYDDKEYKYFIDQYTIIKPNKEVVPTREQFFQGDN